jgi:hypothetical protein
LPRQSRPGGGSVITKLNLKSERITMPYSPGDSDRSGELLAEGIRQGNSKLADLVMGLFSHWQAKNDAATEKTARGVQARAALAKLDPDNADQYHAMSADDALGVASVMPEVLQQSRAKKSQSALSSFFTGVNKDTAPKTVVTSNEPMAMSRWSMLNPGGSPPMATTPGMTLKDAIISGAMRNPGAMESPVASRMFDGAMRAQMAGSKAPPQLMDLGGTKVIWDSTTGKFIAPRLPNSKPIRSPQDSPPVKSPDGKLLWDYASSTWKPIAGEGKPSFMDLLGAPDGEKGGTAKASTGDIPTVASREDYDGLESGAQYYDAQGNLRKKK